MERREDLILAENILGKNFIGPDKLHQISEILGIKSPLEQTKNIPLIPFSKSQFERYSEDFILILGIQKAKDRKNLSINYLRQKFGTEPKEFEPCFYNQDWYLNEKFARNNILDNKWYFVKKSVKTETRGQEPENFLKNNKKIKLPSAILCAYAFFANYLLNGTILWKDDFVWCSDLDGNGDRIYAGRYSDPKKINKNGFNIHRHLRIKNNYGFTNII